MIILLIILILYLVNFGIDLVYLVALVIVATIFLLQYCCIVILFFRTAKIFINLTLQGRKWAVIRGYFLQYLISFLMIVSMIYYISIIIEWFQISNEDHA